MTRVRPATIVRPAGLADARAIGAVAYATGFFGRSAERFFPDARLFRHLWVAPYYRTASAVGFVAVREGTILGYILGATDDRAYREALGWTVRHRVLPALVRGRYRAAFGAVPYLLRFARFPGPHAPTDRYPAHLHINLLPAARGSGVGRELLDTYLAALHDRGVPGVQLSTTRENTAALRLYEKVGFTVHAERETPLWTPWLGHPTRHVVMVRDLR